MTIEFTNTQLNYLCEILAEKDTDEADAVLMQICAERTRNRNQFRQIKGKEFVIMKKPKFYKDLSDEGKKKYDEIETLSNNGMIYASDAIREIIKIAIMYNKKNEQKGEA